MTNNGREPERHVLYTIVRNGAVWGNRTNYVEALADARRLAKTETGVKIERNIYNPTGGLDGRGKYERAEVEVVS